MYDISPYYNQLRWQWESLIITNNIEFISTFGCLFEPEACDLLLSGQSGRALQKRRRAMQALVVALHCTVLCCLALAHLSHKDRQSTSCGRTRFGSQKASGFAGSFVWITAIQIISKRPWIEYIPLASTFDVRHRSHIHRKWNSFRQQITRSIQYLKRVLCLDSNRYYITQTIFWWIHCV